MWWKHTRLKRCYTGIAAMGLLAAMAQAGEPPGPPPPPGPDAPPPPHQELDPNLRELARKHRAGQDLTPEEREKLRQGMQQLREGGGPMGERRMGPGGPEGGPPAFAGARGQPHDPIASVLRTVNAVDRAALNALRARFDAGEKEPALAEAKQFIEAEAKRPQRDPAVAGVARLIVGRMENDLGKTEDATQTLRTVTGSAAAHALPPLLEPYQKDPQAEPILAAYKQLLAMQPTPLDRCRLLNALQDWLDQPGARRMAPPVRAQILKEAATTVPVEEAMASQEALAKEAAAQMPPPGGPRGFMGEGPPDGPPPPGGRGDGLKKMLRQGDKKGAKHDGEMQEGEGGPPPAEAGIDF